MDSLVGIIKNGLRRMQVITGGNDRKQQDERATDRKEGFMMRNPGRPTALPTPLQKTRKRQKGNRNPNEIEQQFHAGHNRMESVYHRGSAHQICVNYRWSAANLTLARPGQLRRLSTSGLYAAEDRVQNELVFQPDLSRNLERLTRLNCICEGLDLRGVSICV